MPTLDFGVEIECLVPSINAGQRMTQDRLAAVITAAGVECHGVGYNHHLSRVWKIVSDGSLRPTAGQEGFEIVSPPLDETGLDQVTKVCEALTALGATVNKSCGLHVHIGARNFSVAVHKKLAELYVSHEPVLDMLMPGSRRGNANSYCRSMIGVTPTALAQTTTVDQIARLFGGDRFKKLNFTAYWRHGTVEFRHHSGTVSADKIIKWIVMCNALVAAAKKEASEPTSAISMVGVNAQTGAAHIYWQQGGRRRRMLFQLLIREGGVTRAELAAALNLTSLPLIRRHLVACGAPTRTYGRRGGHDIYQMPQVSVPVPTQPDTLDRDHGGGEVVAQPITLDGMCTRLELSPEDKAYWTERAASFTPTGQDREQMAQLRRAALRNSSGAGVYQIVDENSDDPFREPPERVSA